MHIIWPRESQLCKLVDHSEALLVFLNPQGKIISFNNRFKKEFTLTHSRIKGSNYLDILFPHNNPINKQMFKSVMDECIFHRRPKSFECIINLPKTEVVICWSFSPIKGFAGRLKGVLLIGNDISALREHEKKLRNIDNTFKGILSNIRDYALFATNLQRKITYFGIGSEAMLGWQKEEIIFKDLDLLFKKEDFKDKLPEILKQAQNFGKAESEIELVCLDGQKLPVNLSISKFIDKDGELLGYIFIAKDITEKRRLEYELFQAEKMAAIGMLAAGMAHEINNPVFVISGRLELLLDTDIPEKTRSELEIIKSQVDRIRKLVDNLLIFARKKDIHQQMLNINEVISSVIPFLSYQKGSVNNIEIVTEFDSSLALVKGDLNQLQEVFLNLFVNACQAMPEGGKLEIRTKKVDDDSIEVSVCDTGSGISRNNLKNIFMPFFSTKKDGTGLGLSVCYKIIKNHTGDINVYSEDCKGTKFVVRLPIVKES